ncbi:MAG: aminopeptidase P family protein [Synergistaceae bacterium]|jgi:Xaa-Pro aminopeptidase|nr:aminopeptidase P family protein [Synergistaceae bacterium]
MFNAKRIDKLAEELSRGGIDALFMGPSTDLEYLAGLRLFDDERVKGLMVSREGKCFAMVPLLYREEMTASLGQDVSYKIWADHEGFASSWAAGCAELGLEGKRIAINDGVRAVDLIEMRNAVDFKWANGAETLSPLRREKDEAELDCLRKAGEIADKVMDGVSRFIREGITEKDVIDKITRLYEENGAEGLSFSPIVASGPGGSMPHYSRSDRTLRQGDFIVVDTGCRFHGYCSDMTRTFCLGEPDETQRKIYGIVLEAQKTGEAAVLPGATGQDVDRASRKVINDAGYGDCFLNRVGHGVGIAIHESPYIIEGNETPLAPGNVFSIEPGIYIEGKYGVRIENLVAVRQDGTAEALNKFTRELVIIK